MVRFFRRPHGLGMMGIVFRLIRRFFKRSDGNVAIVFALTLPLVIGGAGFGVETSYWYYRDLQLQGAADAAAYGAAIEKRAGSESGKVETVATGIAVANGFDATAGTIVVNSPPKSGPNAGKQAVEVLLTVPLQRAFTRIFSDAPVVENVRAVANFQTTGNACILALDPTASKSVLFSGNTSTTIKGCNVMANSIAADAIKTQGSSATAVDCFISGGGVDLSGGSVQQDCKSAVTQAPPVGDPFAYLKAPTDGGGSKNSNGATLQPGNYTSGMSLKNNVNLKPGTYIVSGGDFSVNANANVSGSGVTIYLVGGARVSMNGNATINLSAPTSGTYSGMLFMGDQTSAGGGVNRFNGTAGSSLTGAIYFKKQPVQYLGNFSGLDGCTQVVAATIEWSGSTTINQDCSKYGMQNIPASQIVHLAE